MVENTSIKEMISENLFQEIERTTLCSVLQKTERMREKCFLITGANGFIAYYLVLTILNANDKFQNNNHLILLARSQEKALKRFGQILDREDVTLLLQDVCTPLPQLEQVDYVIHAASAADAQHFNADPIGVFNSNVIGTENILQFVNKNKCESAVYVSSFTVYGRGTDKEKLIEESFCGADPWNYDGACYSYGKRSAEFLCMTFARKYGTPIKIVRPGFVYGASHKDDNRVYAEIIRCAAKKYDITLQSAGLLYRSMVYVTDVVTAILAVLLEGRNGEAYNIANEHTSIRQFAEVAVKVAACEQVKLKFINEADAKVNIPEDVFGAMSIQKIREECKWSPNVSLHDGIASAVAIFSELLSPVC